MAGSPSPIRQPIQGKNSFAGVGAKRGGAQSSKPISETQRMIMQAKAAASGSSAAAGRRKPNAANVGRFGQFSTVLSSDSVGPEELCTLAYQDSETDLTGAGTGRAAGSDTYAAQRLPGRRKSPHKKNFIEPQESDVNIDDDDFGRQPVAA